MRALIFNSGSGTRMGDFTRSHPKSLARLSNGETIFGRQLRLLTEAGINEFVVTTGPFADQLREETRAQHLADAKFTFVSNDDFASTNYIYSMFLAREHLMGDMLLLHGDLVFNRRVLERLLADPRPDLALVDESIAQPEKDFKARVVGGFIREVSVSVSDPDCFAFQPLYKLSARAVDLWLRRVVEFVERGETGVYAENALNEVAEVAAIAALSYSDDSVDEVDTVDDLERVSQKIRLFDFAEQTVLSGSDEIARIPELLGSARVRRPLLVGGKSFDSSLVRPLLDEHGLDFVRFADYSENPKVEEVRAGLAVYRREGCDGIVSVGGGSAIDVAKCIQLLAASGEDDFVAFGSPLPRRVPHLCVPTSAGTGSESTHFAVVYVDGVKHSIAHDALVPDWVILEPRLLETLPEYHKKSALLDALAQCVESSWAASATDQSIDYASRGIRLILDNVFAYFHKAGFDEVAARNVLIAANLGGKAINLTKTTAPHAMSYKMTELYGIAHGHAAALCLMGVWRLFVKLADDTTPEGLAVAPALDRLAEVFGVKRRRQAVGSFELVLEALRVSAPPLGDPANLDVLVGSVNQERLGNSPVPLSEADLRAVYEFVFELRPAPFSAPKLEDRAARVPIVPARERHRRLAALQAYELDILDAFDRFCSEHHLQYYLSEGSMLGAVRHGGVIPWDDDIDVMMPRDDYRRFVELALGGALPPRLALDSFETNKRHWVLGAKLQLTDPTEFYLPKVAKLALFAGPYIDIFPVDAVKRTSGLRFHVQKLLLRGLRRLLFMSSGRSRRLRRKPVFRIPLYAVSKLVSTPTIHSWIVWAQSKFNSSPEAAHWANLCSYYPVDREVFPREWFGSGRRVPFEGRDILVPLRASEMLEKIYGPSYARIPVLARRSRRSHAFVVRSSQSRRSGMDS